MASKSRSQEGRTRRGFAAMDPEERREISRRGGEASHQSGRGHEFSSEEAREAGRRGGEARWGRSREEADEERGHSPAGSRYDQEIEERIPSPSRSRDIESSRYEEEDIEERGGRSRRELAPMEPEERREIGRRGVESRRMEEDVRPRRISSRIGPEPRSSRDEDEGEYGFRSRPHSSRYPEEEFEERGVGRGRRTFEEPYSEERRGRSVPEEERSGIGRRGESRWGRDESDLISRESMSRPRPRSSSTRDEEERSGGRSRRGFAAMDPREQREIARRGGQASGKSRACRSRDD